MFREIEKFNIYISYVFDWSHAMQGNASEDVARTYLLFKLAKKDELAEKYIRLFCKKSDTELQYVQSWLPIVAASQLVKKKPEEKEFLERCINVVITSNEKKADRAVPNVIKLR